MPSRRSPASRNLLSIAGARYLALRAIPIAILLTIAPATIHSQSVLSRSPHSEASETRAWNALPNSGFYNGQVLAIAQIGDDVYVGGYFHETGDHTLAGLGHIARYDTVARTWHALPNQGLSAIVYALAVSGNDLYVGGGFSLSGDGALTGLDNIARYDTVSKTWHALPNLGIHSDHSQTAVQALALDGDDLFAGGIFTQTGDKSLTDLGNIVRYNISSETWHALSNDGLSGPVRALAVSNRYLYAGGSFEETADGSLTDLGSLARYDGSWHALPGSVLLTDQESVRALSIDGDDVYVGGHFAHTGGGSLTDLNNIARFDGANGAWHALPNGGMDAAVYSLAVDGTDLYVGGYLTQTADGTLTDLGHIVRYAIPSERWHKLPNQGLAVGGAGVCKVDAITPIDGELYVGGGFDHTGDGTVFNMGGIARFGAPHVREATLYLPLVLKQWVIH